MIGIVDILVMALPPAELGALHDRLNVVVNIDELNLTLGLDKLVPPHMTAKVEAVAPSAVQVGNVIAAVATDAAGELTFNVFAQVISVSNTALSLVRVTPNAGFPLRFNCPKLPHSQVFVLHGDGLEWAVRNAGLLGSGALLVHVP